jgi:hypothetical protein
MVRSILLLSLLFVNPMLEAKEVLPPAEVLGFEPGEDMKLADWDMIHRYFVELSGASDRVHIESIGKSTQGREMILAAISSTENMAGLDRIKEGMRRLADPRGLDEKEAAALIERLPAVLFVGCAQHSTEIGSTQMSMRLAHRLATDPAYAPTLEQVVLLLIPSMNPDGHQMVCDWYGDHVGTPFEGSRMPWLYHKYVGHDNNRDWAMITQAESINISRVLYKTWFPQIVVDVHQMGNRGARMFIPPYYDPVNPNIDPLIEHQLALISAQMRLDMSAKGLKGIITNAMFDEWLLGYFTSVPTRHNMVSQLIEMASVNVASPLFQRQRDLRGSRGSPDYMRRANFPEPWEGGWWRLSDIVEYEETAVISVLGLAAKNRAAFLQNFYRLGTKQVAMGASEPPFAYLVPRGQRDDATAWEMVAALMRGGVEVHRAGAAFSADDIDYPAGTFVVLMSQPYRAHAKDLLERQTYPNLRTYPGGPPERPYDVAGWTLPLLMGVKSIEVVNPFEADLDKVDPASTLPKGSAPGSRYLLVDRGQNNAFILVNRLLAAKKPVKTLLSDGSIVVEQEAAALVEELGLRALAADEIPDATDLEPVRLGIYQPWTASMDEGWTRWVLERFEFPFRVVHDAEVRAGDLNARIDVLLLPDLSGDSIINGNSEGRVPKIYTGGIGKEGVFALRDFVRSGGTLVALDSSCDFLIDQLELKLTNILAGDRPSRRSSASYDTPESKTEEKKRFFCPGSILKINVDNTHLLAYGMGSTSAIMHVSSPVFEKDKEAREEVEIVGSYPEMNPLMSGWIDQHEMIQGKGALAQARFGEGRAVLIGFRCQFRAQSHGTFKVLFNAILSAGMGESEEK